MSGSFSDEKPEYEEKLHHATATAKEVDSGAQLSLSEEISPEVALRIRYSYLALL